MQLGLIGTGLMGAPMAMRLLAAGHSLSVYNRSGDKTDSLRDQGAAVALTSGGVIEAADVIAVIVSDAAAVRDTVLCDQARAHLGGRVIVNMSTIAPAESIDIGTDVEAAGGIYLEAPVLGSIPQATDGTLIIMVGGLEEHFQASLPFLSCLGTDIRHIGPVGRAAALKLALNQLIASLTAAFALSLGMVQRAEVPLDHFMDILRSSALYAPTFDKKLDKMLTGDYSATNFPARLLLKDIRLCLHQAKAQNLNTAALAGVEEILQITLTQGNAEKDYSSLASAIFTGAGSEVT